MELQITVKYLIILALLLIIFFILGYLVVLIEPGIEESDIIYREFFF